MCFSPVFHVFFTWFLSFPEIIKTVELPHNKTSPTVFFVIFHRLIKFPAFAGLEGFFLKQVE